MHGGGAVDVDLVQFDPVGGVAVAVGHREALPFRRQHGREAQVAGFQFQAEQGFHHQPVHPAGGAGVPGPAAAANVGVDGVDVGADDVRLHFIDVHFGGVAGVAERVDHAQ